MKYVVVTGGVMSGLGKGTTISSMGVVFRAMGYRVTAIKIDPYLNVDAGTMSPFEHGEVFVLMDGGEADLDLGNYERFLGICLTRDHNLTTGKVFERVIAQERAGAYLGKTVQVVPHVTDSIQEWIQRTALVSVDTTNGGEPEICLIEVGGTVGDIESQTYLEALRQLSVQVGPENFAWCHLTYVPTVGRGEQKTKLTQQSVEYMLKLKPDFLFCRCAKPLQQAAIDKMSLFCQVPKENIFSVHDVNNSYEVALLLNDQNFGSIMSRKLKMVPPRPTVHRPSVPSMSLVSSRSGNSSACDLVSLENMARSPASLTLWKELAARTNSKSGKEVKIGVVGKYTDHDDAYMSVVRALQHAACEAELVLNVVWIESSDLELAEHESAEKREIFAEAWKALESVDGVLVPGGFGQRGIHGMIVAVKYCREKSIPFFGICLGLQVAVIEACRNVLNLQNAQSEEFEANADDKVVVYMPETVSQTNMGGTMRLGNRATIICDNESLASALYDRNPVVFERHRHRYEVNIQYVPPLEMSGMRFVGRDEKAQRMEILERQDHPFFFATQYHPEFTSLPTRPNPCFLGFVLASAGALSRRLEQYGGHLRSGASYYPHLFDPLKSQTTTTSESCSEAGERISGTKSTDRCEAATTEEDKENFKRLI